MTDKAYIVANEQQEYEVLCELEQKGFVWSDGVLPTKFFPNTTIFGGEKFPYALIENGRVSWADLSQLTDEEIVYDGRKEDKMSDKYVVSQEFMNELEEWKADIRHEWLKKDDGKWLNSADISDLEDITEDWWLDTEISYKESNNRLIAIIRWVNGEDVFEVEKPKKWVVRSKEPQGSVDGKPLYGWFVDEYTVELEATMPPYVDRFNTREEAESWANSHQEVIEVEI